MAKRRPSGDGMVRKRDDGRWEGRIVVGHKENGEPIFQYVLAPTQKELLAIPVLGKIALDKLTANGLQQFCASLKKEGRLIRTDLYGKGMSDRSVRSCYAVIRMALDRAVKDGLTHVNLAADCKCPPKNAKEMKVLTREEMQRFLIQAKKEG